jgi:hypothetical protein
LQKVQKIVVIVEHSSREDHVKDIPPFSQKDRIRVSNQQSGFHQHSHRPIPGKERLILVNDSLQLQKLMVQSSPQQID